MSNENKKDFNAMMKNNKDMPKIQIVEDEKTIKKYGGSKMFFALIIFDQFPVTYTIFFI